MAFTLFMLLGSAVCCVLAIRIQAAPKHPARLSLMLAAYFGAAWYLQGALFNSARTLEMAALWLYLSPMVIVPTFMFTMLFIVTQLGVAQPRYHRGAYTFVALWTGFLTALHVVPELRFLFADYNLAFQNGTIVFSRTTGLLFPYVLLFNLAVYLTVIGFAVRAAIRSTGVHRRQSLGMLIGTIIPFSFYVGQALLPGIGNGVDPMLLSFLPACFIFYTLTFRQKLISLAPIPRYLLLDAMPDPLIVISGAGVILEANRAARGLGGLPPDSIGRSLQVAPNLNNALGPSLEAGHAKADLELDVGAGGEKRTFAVEISDHAIPGRQSARILMFRDITERSALEHRLSEALAESKARLSENLVLQDQLREQAIRDPLTKLFNRRHCGIVHQTMMERAIREDLPLVALLIDIDHFKAVNDRLGHPAGDRVLVALAETLSEGQPDGAMIFRYGGEEFLALLPDLTAEGAKSVADLWRRDFEDRTALMPQIGRRISFSAGVASFPSDALTWPDLIARADLALYNAKASGRGCTKVWENSMNGAVAAMA